MNQEKLSYQLSELSYTMTFPNREEEDDAGNRGGGC
jgi:hypothetical protein